MVPVLLKLKNFTSYSVDQPPLDFTELQLACITGYNGVGKSSLLDAMTWAVWGWARSGDDSDKLIKLGQTQMSVEFEFDLEGTRYRILRQRKKAKPGTTSLELFASQAESEQWTNLTEGRIKDTQEKIISILHLNYDTFTASSYLRQGNADEFTRQTPNKRKEILAEILGLQNYDELEEKTKEKIKDINIKLQTLDYQITEIDRELALATDYESKKTQAETLVMETENSKRIINTDIKELQARKEKLILDHENYKKITESLAFAEEERDKIISQGKERADRIKRIEILLQDKPQVENELKNLAGVKASYNQMFLIQDKLLKLQTERNSVVANFSSLEAKAKGLENEIKQLETQKESLNQEVPVCPTCGQKLDQEHRSQTLTQLDNKIAIKAKEREAAASENAKVDLEELDKKIKALDFDGEKFGVLKEKIELEERVKTKWEEIIRSEAALETEKKARSELAELFKIKDALVKKLQNSLKETMDVSSSLLEVNDNLRTKESELASAELKERQARDELSQITSLVQRSTQLQLEKEKKFREKAELEEKRSLYEELVIAFGKRGIQAMIIEQAIPEIEDETNALLDKLTEGNLRVSFETQRENKTGGIVETLDIVISDTEGSRSYEMYSGGEAFRVNFAIRLAISKLLTHRAGAKLQFLIIDEGFGTQDALGRERLIEAINLIRNDFEKILIITHVEELKEAFPERIEVTKDAQGSKYQIVTS